jgi:hypothetical protein
MNSILKAVLFCFAVSFALSARTQTVATTSSPEEMVKALYREVQLHAPSGLPSGSDMRLYAPYLSKSLRHKIDLARACEDDWVRQNRGQVIKAPFAWSEFGMFSGANERISPGTFHIQSIRKTDDGSVQVVVGLTYRSGDGSGSWFVIDRLRHENGRFVLEDVSFPKDDAEDGSTLTGRLSQGCDGPRWVGLR